MGDQSSVIGGEERGPIWPVLARFGTGSGRARGGKADGTRLMLLRQSSEKVSTILRTRTTSLNFGGASSTSPIYLKRTREAGPCGPCLQLGCAKPVRLCVNLSQLHDHGSVSKPDVVEEGAGAGSVGVRVRRGAGLTGEVRGQEREVGGRRQIRAARQEIVHPSHALPTHGHPAFRDAVMRCRQQAQDGERAGGVAWAAPLLSELLTVVV